MTSSTPPPAEHTLDVGSQRVARVYAEALLNAAGQHGQEVELLQELEAFVMVVFAAQPHFESFLASLAVGRDQKAGVIRSTLAGRASALFVNFLLVLGEHERLSLIRGILVEARHIHDQRKGLLRVQVKSAVPLPDDQRARLIHELRTTFQVEPVLETRVDPDILGGLIVRVGDWLYDASVRTQLDTIRNQLFESASHEIQSRRDRFCTAE